MDVTSDVTPRRRPAKQARPLDPKEVLRIAEEEQAREAEHARAVQAEANGEVVEDEEGTVRENPIPFDSFEKKPFPTEVLPDGIREFVEALADSHEIPVDLPGMLALGVLSTAVQRKWTVQPKQDWREPLNLYLAVAMEPGEQKSACFKEMFSPLRAHEMKLVESWRKLTEKTEALNLLKKRGEPKVPVPPRPRLFVDDATQETVAQLLAQQGERLAVASDEGTVFSLICGLYSKTPNNSVFLKAHDGGAYTVDRRDLEKHVVLTNPLLTMALAIQPEMFRLLGSKPELRGQGMVARFLFSQPQSRIGSKTFDGPPIDWQVRDQYKHLVTMLIDARPQSWPAPTDLEPLKAGGKPASIRFSAPAWALMKRVCVGIDHRMGQGGNLHMIQDWASKLRGAIVRIAGLFHVLRCVSEGLAPESVELDVSDLDRAMELGHYLLLQAHIAFATMEADPAEKDAKIVEDWMRRGKYLSFTRRDVQRHSPLRKSSRIDSALGILLDRGHIEKVSRVGGSRAAGYKVIRLKTTSDTATEGKNDAT